LTVDTLQSVAPVGRPQSLFTINGHGTGFFPTKVLLMREVVLSHSNAIDTLLMNDPQILIPINGKLLDIQRCIAIRKMIAHDFASFHHILFFIKVRERTVNRFQYDTTKAILEYQRDRTHRLIFISNWQTKLFYGSRTFP
jgi:hypothetical protein